MLSRHWRRHFVRRNDMENPSAADPVFLDTVTRWIAEQGEVLVLIRYSHKAGSKDFEFFTSADALRTRLGQLSPRDCVSAFGQPQLPLRGQVDEDFVQRAVALIHNGTEFLVVGLELVRYGMMSWFPYSAGKTHEE